MDVRSRAAEWYTAGLLLVYACLFWGHSVPPSLTDYANWTYQGVLLRDHLLGHPDAAHALKPYPVPNSAATLGIGLLSLLLPWTLAAKAWLCVQLAAGLFALKHMLRTVGSGAAAWLIVPGAVFLNLNFWYGFTNFELGLCWLLLLASLLLRQGRAARSGEWKLGVLLLLAFFTHMIPFAFGVLLLVLFAAQTGRWRLLWQALPSAFLCCWYVLGRFLIADNADGQAGMQASVRNYSEAFWAFKGNSYLKSFGFINPESGAYWLLGGSWFAILFLLNLVLALLLGWAMLQAARRGLRRGREERFLWIAVVLAVPLFLLAPGAALGISDPGARILQAALALALVLAAGKQGRVLALGAFCSAAIAAAGIYLFFVAGFRTVSHKPGQARLPDAMVTFAHVPNHDQDYFYGALEHGEMRLRVFPTGMFLNLPGPR